MTRPLPPHRGTLAAALIAAAALLGGCAAGPMQAHLAETTAAAAATPAPTAAPVAETEPPAAQSFPVGARPAGGQPSVAELLAPDAPSAAAAAARMRLDPGDDAARGDLWARVRAGFELDDANDELVRKWEQWYSSRPDYVQRMTERGGRYLFHIVEEVQRRGMPAELALLPFTESAFNPQAESRARAAGMWQFMPLTGKDFELKQNLFRDDRRDVLASTRAALDYLQRLHDMFGDWRLALAAYNWGQGNVQRAITRNQKAGLPTDYWSLRMPDETRNYVPKLQAVKNIVARPADFGLALPALENHPFFLSVPITRDIDVALAASYAGLPLEEFQALNPQMNKPVILAAGTPQVLLPYDNANSFLRQIEMHRGPMASWTAWVAPKTLKPADAAREVGMSEAQLREVNRIPARMLVKAGSTLLVPRAAHSTHDVSEHIADNAMMLLSPESKPLRKLTLKAGKKGESVASVARRHGVSAEQVAAWNKLGAQGSFKPGQSITLMLAQPATRVAAAPAPAGNAATAARKAGAAGTAGTAKRSSKPVAASKLRVATRAPAKRL